jgi:hypothetical protein
LKTFRSFLIGIAKNYILHRKQAFVRKTFQVDLNPKACTIKYFIQGI